MALGKNVNPKNHTTVGVLLNRGAASRGGSGWSMAQQEREAAAKSKAKKK